MPLPIMQHFTYEHLTGDLQKVSREVCNVAIFIDGELPDGAEKVAGLRKLLEAKDCFVRAKVEEMRKAGRQDV